MRRIADETRVHHAEADGERLAIMERPSETAYRSFLTAVHGFEAPIEAACRATRGFDAEIAETHLRSGHLETDLDMLALSPVAPATIAFGSLSEAYGWLYVLVRNTAFHGQILRHLATHLPATMHVASAYLLAFDGVLGTRLRELGDLLDEYAWRTTSADRIVAAARAAFRHQRLWYRCDAHPQLERAA
jgi:heme oxygenase